MIKILRLSHRPERDKRLTTHVALVARAFGADELVYTGVRDPALEESIEKVVKKWGGNFKISFSRSWKPVISGFKGKKVHLTMYGLPLDQNIKKIRNGHLLG
jgi:tRNA (cytidine56-2'-O)-methyltransferase